MVTTFTSNLLTNCSDEAILSSSAGFTAFCFGGYRIRFRVSYSLERYVDVVKWDDGYLVAMMGDRERSAKCHNRIAPTATSKCGQPPHYNQLKWLRIEVLSVRKEYLQPAIEPGILRDSSRQRLSENSSECIREMSSVSWLK